MHLRDAARQGQPPSLVGNALYILAAVALGCLVVAGCATARIEPVASVPNDPEFRTRLDMLARAFESLSPGNVLQFYAQDTYSVFFDFPYASDSVGEDHFKALDRSLAMVRAIRLQPGASVQVSRTEERVWTTRSFTATGMLRNGDTFSFDGWHSAIWEKRGDVWLIVYEHFGSAGPRPAPVVPRPSPAAQPISAPASEVRLRDVFFEYGKWDIRPDGLLNLSANVEVLKANPTVEVTIEGYCDERGGAEYNLQLAQRRADAVKDFLVTNGIAAARLKTVSFGEGRTFAHGPGEPAWGFNRRAHLVIMKM